MSDESALMNNFEQSRLIEKVSNLLFLEINST